MANPNEMSSQRRSHPGDPRPLICKKCALKGELHSRVSSCGELFIHGFVIHDYSPNCAG
jgi:hypothetical protein